MCSMVSENWFLVNEKLGKSQLIFIIPIRADPEKSAELLVQ